MKYLKIIGGILLLLILLLYLTGNGYVLRGVQLVYLKGRTTANIFDASDFENNVVSTQDQTQFWERDSLYNQIPLSENLQNELEAFETTSFLVIKDGKILQEQYWEIDSLTASNSFSMAKTLTTLLVQKAIEDGYISSWDTPFTQYVTEYKDDPLAQDCTIADLSRMTSGFDWKEDYYFPINPTAKAYYDDDMDEVILDRSFIEKPNTAYKYLSGNTQLLGYVLQRSLPQKNISSYLSESFWKPMGMNEDALWTVDHKGGIEKTYCCVHSNARNFAKFGQLLLQDGKWQGKSLIDSTFVQKMKTPNPYSDGHYGYSLWIDEKYDTPFYFLRGHLGQYVICIPEENMVIVRLGEQRDKQAHRYSDGYHPRDVYIFIEETLKSINSIAS